MVKYTGEKSAASLIKSLLGAAWYLGIIFTIVLFIGQIYLFFINPQVFGENVMLRIETPGIAFSFNEGFTQTDAQKLFIYQFALVLPLLAIGLLVIYQLRKILATLVDETPFTIDNARRIAVIGYSIIAATIIRAVLNMLIGLYFSSTVNLPGLELYANIRLEDFSGILIGALVLILAEVFKHGSRLQEEQDLTV
ncbi:MAG: DUF2975 domain-containing protein [Bacillota bacterium]|nr:DUF2975 domain-containing protein [Bacillota bacterium]